MVQRPSAAAGRPESRHPLQFLFFFSPPPRRNVQFEREAPHLHFRRPPPAYLCWICSLSYRRSSIHSAVNRRPPDLQHLQPPALILRCCRPSASKCTASPTAGPRSALLHDTVDRWPLLRADMHLIVARLHSISPYNAKPAASTQYRPASYLSSAQLHQACTPSPLLQAQSGPDLANQTRSDPDSPLQLAPIQIHLDSGLRHGDSSSPRPAIASAAVGDVPATLAVAIATLQAATTASRERAARPHLSIGPPFAAADASAPVGPTAGAADPSDVAASVGTLAGTAAGAAGP
jgi:hypothetical protein